METKNETQKFTPSQIQGWEEYRNSLYIQKSKSDDYFEKAITFISSGALGITLTFHDKIVPIENSSFIFLISLGWFFLVATLFVNLISHYKSGKSIDKSIDEIDDIIAYRINYETYQMNIAKRNKFIDFLNKSSIFLLGSALFLIITYITININYGKESKQQVKQESVNRTDSKNEQSEHKGKLDSTPDFTIK